MSWGGSIEVKGHKGHLEVNAQIDRGVDLRSSEVMIISPKNLDPTWTKLGPSSDHLLCRLLHLLGILVWFSIMILDSKNYCRSAPVTLHRIGQIRKYLDMYATEKLVHAFITSKLDYCNSLLYGLPQYLINKIQHVQNSAARVTAMKRNNVSSILRELHWLPVSERIEYKLLLITYKCVQAEAAPSYLNDLLKKHIPLCTLRSSSMNLLELPRTSDILTNTYGERAFSMAAPKLWNALPNNIQCAPTVQQFKSKLKHYLFTRAFGVWSRLICALPHLLVMLNFLCILFWSSLY